MKPLMVLALLVSIVPEFALGWITPEPIDYETQFSKADFVSIIQIEAISLSDGLERLDSYPKAKFKRIKVSFQIEAILKGKAPDLQICDLLRGATTEELRADHSHDDFRKIALASIANEELHHYVADPAVGKFYLCFLTESEGGILVPTTGLAKSSYSLIEMNPPAKANPNRGEHDGGLKGLQP
jgi:hypothetical protein